MSIRKDDRREEANQRKVERKKRTPQQQIEALDKKLGKGVGAKKERTRLLKQITNGNKNKS